MARFYGIIGYGESIEDPPLSGVWVNSINEYHYAGDVIRNTRKLIEGETPNDLNLDISVGNSISVVADDYAVNNFSSIKYVVWMGVAWAVTNVEIRRPRLILSLGNVYNGPTT